MWDQNGVESVLTGWQQFLGTMIVILGTIEKNRKFHISILNIPSNFVFRFETSKMTEMAF